MTEKIELLDLVEVTGIRHKFLTRNGTDGTLSVIKQDYKGGPRHKTHLKVSRLPNSDRSGSDLIGRRGWVVGIDVRSAHHPDPFLIVQFRNVNNSTEKLAMRRSELQKAR